MKIVLAIDPAQPCAAYLGGLVAGGARPDEVLVVQPGDALPAEFDGLLVSGGSDVEPSRYGETPLNATVEPNPGRDALDFALVARAAQIGAAVFGICRGLQVLNVALGGTLWQDLPSQRPSDVTHSFSTRDGHDPARPAHTVDACRTDRPGLPLAAALAALHGRRLNSRHHQAVKALAPGLVPLATSPDGLVEAFARESGPFLAGVQWHPENLVDDGAQRALFTEFLDAARERAARAPAREPLVTTPEHAAAAPATPQTREAGRVGANHIVLSGAGRPRERAALPGSRAGGAPETA